MEKLLVKGGRPLRGTVHVGGSKNAALPLLFAGILTGESCTFSGLPRVSDVLCTLEILRFLGARIQFERNGDVVIDYKNVKPLMPRPSDTAAIRGSVYLLGAMLSRFGRADFGGCGGCNFGARPIDQHLMGFRLLGAEVTEEGKLLTLTAEGGLCGREIPLKMPSVGATANLLMAATGARGKTTIKNAAAEPHVSALCDFLKKAGARIRGAGTDTVEIEGGVPLHGCHVTIIPDMIEAGTYLAAGMATGGCVTVRGVVPNDLECVFDTLAEMGAELHVGSDFVKLTAPRRLRCTRIETGPYPAFPTDLHPQFAALFALGGRAQGVGQVRERVFRDRFQYTKELQKMGADIKIHGDTATVTPAPLTATTLSATDLRGGAALLIAALAAEGETVIENAALLSRGYEHLEEKLNLLSADVFAL